MTEQKTSIAFGPVLFLVPVLFLLIAGQLSAGILAIGDYNAEPGQTITATVDLSSLDGAEFTSVDVAVELVPSVGDGSSPMLGNASAATDDGWAWSPFDSVNDAQQSFNETKTLAVYGIAGSPIGVTSTLDGTVLQIPITIPADAVDGDVFVLDLREENSNISNNGTALPSSPGWVDGSISIIPEPATSLIVALGLFSLGMIRRRL